MSLRLSFLVAFLLGVTSCGPQSSSSSKASPLTILTWEDYFPEEVLDAFAEEHSVEIELIAFDNAEHMLAMMVSEPERYDVVVTDDHTLRRLALQKLLMELDHEQLSRLPNLGKYAGPSFDPEHSWSVPYLWGTTLLTYNAELVSRPPTRWADLWDPSIMGSGHVAMLQEPVELFSVALRKLGYSHNEASEPIMAEARDALLEQFERVNVRYMNEIEIIEALQNEECAAAMQYSGDAIFAAEENENLRVVIPEEGAPMWMDNFVISTESDQPELSHAFLNYMLEAEVAKACAEWNWYASPNEAAEKILDPELLEDETIYPSATVLLKCEYQDGSEERQRLISMHMRAVKERAKAPPLVSAE